MMSVSIHHVTRLLVEPSDKTDLGVWTTITVFTYDGEAVELTLFNAVGVEHIEGVDYDDNS